MQKYFKRFIGLTLLLTLLSEMIVSIAETDPWNCPNCGRTGNTDNFCGDCAHPAPWIDNQDFNIIINTSTPAPIAIPTDNPPPTQKPAQEEKQEEPTVPFFSEMYPGIIAHLRAHNDSRVYSYFGPGDDFSPAGGIIPSGIKRISVFFELNGFVLADIDHKDLGRRFVYLPKDSITTDRQIPVLSELKYYKGITTTSISPAWGPDVHYNFIGSFAVNAGEQIKIFFQEKGFVYAEYECSKGTVCMWLPANNIDTPDAIVKRNKVAPTRIPYKPTNPPTNPPSSGATAEPTDPPADGTGDEPTDPPADGTDEVPTDPSSDGTGEEPVAPSTEGTDYEPTEPSAEGTGENASDSSGETNTENNL